MRLSAALKLLAVLAAALAVGLVAATKSMDVARLKGLAAEQVQAATGRTLAVSGPLELRLGLKPRLIASGVTLSNMAGGSRPEMVKIERIEAEVALLPLLKREIRIQRLIVSSPDILLESDSRGRGNWSFTPAAPKAAAAAPADKAGEQAAPPATRFTLREVKIKNARLAWRNGASGGTRTFNLHKLTIQPDPNASGLLAVQALGDLESRMLTLGGRVGMPQAAGKPWAVQLQGNFDGLQAKVEGNVADPLAGQGIELTLAAQGDELGKVVRLAEPPGPPPLALGPFKLAGHLTDARGALGITDLDLSAGRRDALVVTARGTIRDIGGLAGVELAVGAESDTIAGLSRLTGAEVPPIGPLKASAQLSGGGTQWKLADIKAALAGSDAGGELALDIGGHPRLTGMLAANALMLADFTTPASKPGEKLASKGLKAAGDGRLFPAEPLALGWLRAVDAKLALSAHRVDLGGLRLSEASAELALAGGRLALRPVRAWVAGGPAEGELVLAALPKGGAELAVRASGRGVDLGRLLKESGVDALTGGRTDARLDLRGTGQSWRELMASASGEVVVNVDDGRLRNTAIDWAGGDLLVQLVGVLNPLSRSEDTTPLSCAVVRFVVRDGIATADRGIAVETAKVNVVGAGTINLRDEHLDLGITPRARDGIGLSLTSPLAGMTRVRGTLAEPSLSLDELGTARTAASVGAALATGGLSLVGEALFDRVTADANPCRTALGSAASPKPAAKAPDKKTRKARKDAP